jgi:hypothetical protein
VHLLSDQLVENLQLNASALYDTYDNDNDGNNQENMNKPSHGIRADKAKKPEDQQNDCDGFEHGVSPFDLRDLHGKKQSLLNYIYFLKYFIKQSRTSISFTPDGDFPEKHHSLRYPGITDAAGQINNMMESFSCK